MDERVAIHRPANPCPPSSLAPREEMIVPGGIVPFMVADLVPLQRDSTGALVADVDRRRWRCSATDRPTGRGCRGAPTAQVPGRDVHRP